MASHHPPPVTHLLREERWGRGEENLANLRHSAKFSSGEVGEHQQQSLTVAVHCDREIVEEQKVL